MLGELAGLAGLVLLVPAILAAQHIHDWWSNPTRAFWRRVWVTEHLRVTSHPRPPGEATVGRDSAGTSREAVDGGSKQPVAVDEPPDSATTGVQPHPRDEEVADAAGPRLAVSATRSVGAVAQTAPTRSTA